MKILHTGSGDHLDRYSSPGTMFLVIAILAAVLMAGCTSLIKIPSSTGSQAGSGGTTPWSGSWDSNWGTMQFTQSGDQVTATYTHNDGRITGTVSGNTLTGTWSESPSYQPPDDAGDVVLTLSADGKSFTGNWRYGSNTGTWDGTWTANRK